MNEIRHDRPIESEASDQLDRGPFVESLVRALVVDKLNETGAIVGRHATGYVVGLTGRWGLGKSSVLNLLAQKLESMDNVIVALFNPWLFSGRDELVSGFFNTLRSAMGRSGSEEARELVGAIDRYWGAINVTGHGVAAVLDLQGGLGTATATWKSWGPRLRAIFKSGPRTPDEERFALEQKISKANCAIVVLIDELDRVEDDEVRAVAQLVKAVGAIKGVSYLVAYDPDRVVEALGRGEGGERRRSGELYLEKIIQHPIPLRPLLTEDTELLLNAAFESHGVALDLPHNDSQKAMLDHLIDVIETPREVKRLVGAFSILERAVRGEICPYDVLGYCWILTKSPALRDKIANHMEDLVSDPSERVMANRVVRSLDNHPETSISEVLGEPAHAYTSTLDLLFPRSEERASSDDSGDRLSKRRNLVRMLYLGNPPGAVRRSELEGLWSNPDVTELEVELRHLMDEGKLPSAIDRLGDLLFSLPESGDRTFWVALSRTFFRSSDWLSQPDAARALADDSATALIRMALRESSQAYRFRTTIEALIAGGDLILVPFVLRKHLFAHGLTKHSSTPRGGEVLTRHETESLLISELPRYREAVLNGTALRRLPNVEVIYVIANTDNWDEEIRTSFTAQLSNLEAVSTLAGLVVPPGFSADRASLDELFDTETVKTTIEALVAAEAFPADPWMAESLQRLRRILAGGEPDFDET